MADEMARWGPDGVNASISGNAAFGHALLIVTHESPFEKQPCIDQNEGILFTAAARLDNRDELCDVFGIGHPERPTTPDGQLVLQAYRKWGAESCKHLFGDWSFAAWHRKEQKLFLARDHIGNTGLYYYFKPPLLVFASSTEAILSHPDVPRELDELHLAQRLVFDYSQETWSRSYWKDVCYLPTAHVATYANAEKKVERYWQLEDAPTIRLATDTEYLEGFLDHFRRAVRVRLNSIRPVGSTLSAGLDSSSVTALAAEALRAENLPLIAYTSVPLHPAEKLFPNRLTNEWPLAHQVAMLHDNIEHIQIRAENLSILDAIQTSLKVAHEPRHAAINMTWILSIFDDARFRNLGVMLTGQFGNGGVSWSGGTNYILHLFMKNQWSKGLIALKSWKEFQGVSWFRTLKNQLLRPLLIPYQSKYLILMRLITKKDMYYAFPRADFIKKMGLKKNSSTGITLSPLDPLSEHLQTIVPERTRTGAFWASLGSFNKMSICDPTADVHLLKYCMGVPDEQNTFAGGHRMLIRRAMNGILPESVRWNTLRGKQAADAVFRLVSQRNDIERELNLLESVSYVTPYLDISAIKGAWKKILSYNAPTLTIDAFLRSINTAYFLRALAERPKQPYASKVLEIKQK
jgi:asparagine synthase (glutamine-hydrolysing)